MPTNKPPVFLPSPDWPEGGELFADIARRAVPSLTDSQCAALAVVFLGHPGIENEWTPPTGQDARSVLVPETTVMALMVQAWGERAQWALAHCADPVALRNYDAAIKVLQLAVRFLKAGKKGGAK
jgi:hypothetical protein